MSLEARTAKVWIALVVSMTVGAGLLMIMDSQSLSAGAFSLAAHTKLQNENAVQDILTTEVDMKSSRWDRIEVFYSRTEAGNLSTLAMINDHVSIDDMNLHFVVCNGDGAENGLIQPSKRWKKQYPCLSQGGRFVTSSTLRICVIGANQATDSQLKRVDTLVETLCARFNIKPVNIDYPRDWEL